MWDTISKGLTSIFGGAPSAVNGSAGIGAMNAAPTGGLWGMLTSDALKNGLDIGTDLFGAYNNYKTSQLANKGFKQNMALSADAYARDKEAERKRHALNF